MTTVFAILLIVIYLGKGLILLVNKYAPEEVVPDKKGAQGSLFAVGFQGLLILVCVAIYAVLIQSIATDGDPVGAIWGCVGSVSYTHLHTNFHLLAGWRYNNEFDRESIKTMLWAYWGIQGHETAIKLSLIHI